MGEWGAFVSGFGRSGVRVYDSRSDGADGLVVTVGLGCFFQLRVRTRAGFEFVVISIILSQMGRLLACFVARRDRERRVGSSAFRIFLLV